MSEYPSDWSVRSLGEVAERIRRTSVDQNLDVLTISSTEGWVDQKRKWARDMAGKSIDKYTLLERGEFSYNRGNSKTYPQGCIFRLESWDRALVPNVYHSFRVINPEIDGGFVQHFFAAGGLNEQLRSVITSSVRDNGLLNITADTFFASELPIPSLPEQKKIAEILSGIDNHIDAIKKQITALVLLRSSILEQSLKRFADCPVRPLHEITERITVGIVSKPADHYVSKGVPALRSMNIKEGRIDYRDIRFISKESNEAFKKSMIKKGDILTVRTGAPGTSAVAPADLEGANCVDVILSTPAPGIDSSFLCLQINSNSIKSKVFTAQGGLAQQHFNVGEMRDLEVLVPPLEIQRGISCSVNTVTACIYAKDRYKVKLEELKCAMSSDLLSGRKRVTL